METWVHNDLIFNDLIFSYKGIIKYKKITYFFFCSKFTFLVFSVFSVSGSSLPNRKDHWSLRSVCIRDCWLSTWYPFSLFSSFIQNSNGPSKRLHFPAFFVTGWFVCVPQFGQWHVNRGYWAGPFWPLNYSYCLLPGNVDIMARDPRAIWTITVFYRRKPCTNVSWKCSKKVRSLKTSGSCLTSTGISISGLFYMKEKVFMCLHHYSQFSVISS